MIRQATKRINERENMPLFPAVILAGGQSLRMGQDKASLTLENRSLLEHVHARVSTQASAVIISRHSEDTKRLLDTNVIYDRSLDFHGPLSGILSTLQHVRALAWTTTHMLSVAVDTPFFPATLVKQLADATPDNDCIIVARSSGRIHPVFALWPLPLCDDLELWLHESKHRSLMAFINRHRYHLVDFPLIETNNGQVDPFFNINTPQDLETARLIAPFILQT